jgi:hypothetical protein
MQHFAAHVVEALAALPPRSTMGDILVADLVAALRVRCPELSIEQIVHRLGSQHDALPIMFTGAWNETGHTLAIHHRGADWTRVVYIPQQQGVPEVDVATQKNLQAWNSGQPISGSSRTARAQDQYRNLPLFAGICS